MSVNWILTGCATAYSYNSIEIKIIDEETKQPLEDVIVVAHWTLDRGTLGGNVEVGTLQVMEAVSDKNGRVHFSEWGPKTIYRGRLDGRGAQLIFFKPDYEIKGGGNKDPLWQSDNPKTSQWDGTVVEMKKFQGNLLDYAEFIRSLDNELNFARKGKNCEWKSIPKMLVAIHKMSIYFDSKNIRLKGWMAGRKIRKVTDVGRQDKCGSAEDYFKAFLNE
jgi:hypothetical protein